ncbi:MAG: hypothetical protein VR68_04235 [Peptococcaceae bacterium BRH_c4a]|nr:MAG: hypothetical protein VR68_04235 [Peptococcaceae bacterium BRH_c4a]
MIKGPASRIIKVGKAKGGKAMGKHIRTVNANQAILRSTLQGRGCGECQASCQSACKTSCTVGNQVCLKEKKQ